MSVTRVFEMADQQRFADLSRDWNPLHLDAVSARRTIAGEVVVHGMHLLAWSLDHYWRQADAALGAAAVSATFLRPVLLGKLMTLTCTPQDDGTIWMQLDHAGAAHMTARLTPGAAPAASRVATSSGTSTPASAVSRTPRDWEFAALKNASGSLLVESEPVLLNQEFPHACKRLGPAPVAALLALSRLVGMEMPGAHSLFAGVELKFGTDLAPRIDWAVRRHSVRQAPLLVSVSGSGIEGTLTAFMRPAPTAQPDMTEVRGAVPAHRFSGQRALVVGGSRGLGELAAKIVSAGGGEACITYLSGAADAARVAGEIRAAGGRCETRQFDAQGAGSDELATLMRTEPTHIYFFATPRIAASAGPTESAVLQRYRDVYVDSFARLCRAAAGRRVAVLYPSSVFVDEKPAGFADYVAAKSEGEAQCSALNDELPDVHVMCVRLPRLRTDQTAALLARGVAEPLPLLAGLIEKFHDFNKGERS